jgi:hypothetical protein
MTERCLMEINADDFTRWLREVGFISEAFRFLVSVDRHFELKEQQHGIACGFYLVEEALRKKLEEAQDKFDLY